MQVFTNEINELPRSAVADFLEEINLSYCARYLEYLITERGECSTLFHDRLAELYLEMVISAKKRDSECMKSTHKGSIYLHSMS